MMWRSSVGGSVACTTPVIISLLTSSAVTFPCARSIPDVVHGDMFFFFFNPDLLAIQAVFSSRSTLLLSECFIFLDFSPGYCVMQAGPADKTNKVRRPAKVAAFLRRFPTHHRTDVTNQLLLLGLEYYIQYGSGEADLETIEAFCTSSLARGGGSTKRAQARDDPSGRYAVESGNTAVVHVNPSNNNYFHDDYDRPHAPQEAFVENGHDHHQFTYHESASNEVPGREHFQGPRPGDPHVDYYHEYGLEPGSRPTSRDYGSYYSGVIPSASVSPNRAARPTSQQERDQMNAACRRMLESNALFEGTTTRGRNNSKPAHQVSSGTAASTTIYPVASRRDRTRSESSRRRPGASAVVSGSHQHTQRTVSAGRRQQHSIERSNSGGRQQDHFVFGHSVDRPQYVYDHDIPEPKLRRELALQEEELRKHGAKLIFNNPMYKQKRDHSGVGHHQHAFHPTPRESGVAESPPPDHHTHGPTHVYYSMASAEKAGCLSPKGRAAESQNIRSFIKEERSRLRAQQHGNSAGDAYIVVDDGIARREDEQQQEQEQHRQQQEQEQHHRQQQEQHRQQQEQEQHHRQQQEQEQQYRQQQEQHRQQQEQEQHHRQQQEQQEQHRQQREQEQHHRQQQEQEQQYRQQQEQQEQHRQQQQPVSYTTSGDAPPPPPDAPHAETSTTQRNPLPTERRQSSAAHTPVTQDAPAPDGLPQIPPALVGALREVVSNTKAAELNRQVLEAHLVLKYAEKVATTHGSAAPDSSNFEEDWAPHVRSEGFPFLYKQLCMTFEDDAGK